MYFPVAWISFAFFLNVPYTMCYCHNSAFSFYIFDNVLQLWQKNSTWVDEQEVVLSMPELNCT